MTDSPDNVIDAATQFKKRKSRKSRKQSKPDEPLSDTFTEADLNRMNRHFAVVSIGGKVRVVSFEQSDVYPGARLPVLWSIYDFIAFHATPKKETIVNDVRKRYGIGRWWIEHPGRRQHDGLVYAPGEDVDGKLNLWTGFTCDPISGSCEKFLNHVRDNICAGNPDHYEYLIRYMARTVQCPGEAGQVAVVLRGREGVGKGVFVGEFGALFGAHFRHISHGSHLTGHFNAHLQHCSVLFADEAFFAGDRSHESVLKALITERALLIEPKGVDPYSVRNSIHLFMASNSKWVVPAGADARRYFVLDVSDARMQDTEYFEAITHEMRNGGRSALLHFLQTVEVLDFNVRNVPVTAALADQKTRSRRGVDRLVEMLAHDGRLPSTHIAYFDVAVTSGEEKGEGFYIGARKLVPDLKHESSIIINNTLKREWGCASWTSHGQRGIKFPPLSELRARFDRAHGQQEWDEQTEWSAL